MRHLNAGRKFDRDGSSRAAMFKNLVANLFANERIETTVPKAKEVRRIAERLITRAARLGADVNAVTLAPDAAAKRLALKRSIGSVLPQWGERLVNGEPERIDVVEHLFREIAPRYLKRPGGYTRILKTRNRRGDNAEMAIIELVDRNLNVGKAVVTADSVVRSAAPRSRKTETTTEG
jgi:large subunit ribosomal protein L17